MITDIVATLNQLQEDNRKGDPTMFVATIMAWCIRHMETFPDWAAEQTANYANQMAEHIEERTLN